MPNQSGPPPIRGVWREGAQVSAAQMQAIVDSLSHRIVGDGKNIRVRTFPGGQICIEGPPVRVRGGSFSEIRGYEVDFIVDLPPGDNIPRKSFAWVNENNGLYMRNPANNGWICLNRFE